jgi:hypothetical protein
VEAEDMNSKEMTRKDFITLTFTLIGSAAVASRCSNDNTTPTPSPTGVGGTTAQSGGTTGHAGAGGTTGTAGTTGAAGTGDAGTTVACTDPLPETMVADGLGHMHTVTVPASTLNATSVQTFTTSVAGSPAHTHTVALTANNLAIIKGGGSVTVVSGPADGHTHMFVVSCH